MTVIRQLLPILFFAFLAFSPNTLQATHIVGGEMTYRCLGNNQYEIKLTIFRDCFNGIPWFDNPASIGIFSNATGLPVPGVPHLLVDLNPSLNDTLNPTLVSDCLVIPPNVCVNTTTYTTNVTLPFLAGGYHLVYQRCCRNNTIANLILPEDVGATYSIQVSEQALLECNSSPVFNDWPPLFLCVGLPFEIDQSAFDEDGDSLVYRLCNPLTGGTPANPQPVPPNNPPYDTVPWLPPFGVDNMTNIPAVDVMTIDPVTGLLTGTPNLLGQFVIGICVEEYRNGVLIGTNRRDYQVNIGDCEIITAAFFAPETICGSFSADLDNQSLNASNYLWYFNDPANPGASSTSISPSYTYGDYGTYEITLIAEPNSICVDTFTTSITFQPESLTPDFEIQVIQCQDELLVQGIDLSVDTISTITGWLWVLETNGNVYVSEEQNPIFTVGETGPALMTLQVTSANGCNAVLEMPFLLKDKPLFLDLGPDIQLCGPQTIELTASIGFDSYLWSTSEETQSISVTGAGTYSVVAIDACGQEQFDEIIISIDTTDINLPDTVLVCEGGNFTFDVPGFISYEWSPADYLSCTDCPNPTTTPLTDITYTLSAVSADSCVAFDEVHVFVLENIQTSENIALCNGDTIEIFGNPVFAAGDYSDTFTASNGCDSTHTVSVSIIPTITIVEDVVICEGDTIIVFGMEVFETGEFSVTLTGSNGCDSTHIIAVGVLPNFFTTESIAICAGESVDIFGTPTSTAGEYSMTFDASNSCDSTHTITLTVYDEVILETETTSATCFGSSDGTASVTASGGSGGFTYLWNTGDTGATITGQPAGNYTVVVTDVNGCTAEVQATIGEPTAVEVVIDGVNVSCDELGSASANATGGTAGYTYEWSTGDSGANIFDLVAGTYSVTASDANGCTAESSVAITGALGPSASISVDQLPSAANPNSGALSVSVAGGTAPFDIEWSNGATTSAISGLGSGEYTVTVTDDNGCTATAVAQLFIPACTGGKLWNDKNRDGCQMGGEFGLAGITVQLTGTDIWGNAISMSTTSAINGEYIFEPLPPGDYQMFLPVPSGWVLSPANACSDDFIDSDFAPNGMSYVVNLTEGHCCLIVDGGLYDACLQVINPGSICCNQVLCGPGNDPAPINSTAPATGAGGPIEYMWMYSTAGGPVGDGSWTPIPGTNSPSYNPGPISQTTYYARCVRAIGCADWLEGNVVEVFVDDVAIAQISGPNSACVGDQVTYSAASNGPGATYSWNFGPWATPSTANTPNVNVTWNQAGVVYVTLTVTANGCTSTTSYGVAISNSPVYCASNIGNGGNGPNWSTISKNEVNFSAFPNPADDHITVRWDEEIGSSVNIELLGLDGRQLMSAKADGTAQSYRADLSQLVSGMYMLRVQYDNGEQMVFRVVKQ